MANFSNPCTDSGVGTRNKCRYSENLEPINDQPHPYTCNTYIKYDPFQFYGLFSGFNGGDEVAKYVMDRLVHVIFKVNPITVAQQPHDVVKSLQQKYKMIVDEYFNSHHEKLTNRLIAKNNGNLASVQEIDEKIGRGTTIIVALIIRNNLYIISCGRSMAIVVQEVEKQATSHLLNQTLHENTNGEEIDRLLELQVDPSLVDNPTRAIGDFLRSYLYDEIEIFKDAKDAPIISEPVIQHFQISTHWKYLILLSDGVVENLKNMNIENIPEVVLKELKEEPTPRKTAQALVDAIARNYADHVSTKNVHVPSTTLEEMTILFHKMTTFKSEINFTVDSTTDSGIVTTLVELKPYVDASHDKNCENFKLMETYLLK
ncbi:unnamed protein product [Caenorhabditis angaria]|uniref:PPM-type phosphatase domain-containing protein n=1 Tax=Caenorhabditis angaria TaxID=860376 RepID=A0A9P1NBF1_9PELO|nr:unnamed protein product [Caenorhabditis angaria]